MRNTYIAALSASWRYQSAVLLNSIVRPLQQGCVTLIAEGVIVCERSCIMGREGKRKPDRDNNSAGKKAKYFSTVRWLARLLLLMDMQSVTLQR